MAGGPKPAGQLDAVALAVVETDGLDPGKTAQGPGQAGGGTLAAGEQHQGGHGVNRAVHAG